MGQAKPSKACRLQYRQERILDLISKPGGASATQLSERFHVGRHIIIQDVRDLRAMGYPIQTYMKTEKNIYGVAFELVHPPTKR